DLIWFIIKVSWGVLSSRCQALMQHLFSPKRIDDIFLSSFCPILPISRRNKTMRGIAMRNLGISVLLCGCITLDQISSSLAASVGPNPAPRYAPHRVLVKFRDQTPRGRGNGI